MRKLSTLSVTLFSCSLLVGCADDAAPASRNPPSSTSETRGAPMGDSGSESDTNAPPSSDAPNDQPGPTTGGPSNEPTDNPTVDDPPVDNPPEAQPDPGPKPTEQCSVQKDNAGFFTRESSKSDYVGYVPASYSFDKAMRVIVGLHGCGDNAMNFATWGVNPYDTRTTQDWIGISVGGETGNNKCWSMGGDDDKVLAAVEDLAKCFWLDRSRVVVAGFSSGGQLAYRVGMKQSKSFAGVLIENSALYAAGDSPDKLLAGAAWKLPIAHRAHTSDSVFPLDKVKADWALTKKAGFPIATSEVAGGHDGSSADWTGWLIPQSANWVLPAK